MEKVITWQGPFDGSGAYPTINRNLTRALGFRGWKVLENLHNDGDEITPILAVCEYPPPPLRLSHEFNVCISNWEFSGPRGVPISFVRAYNTYDLVIAKSRWTAKQYRWNGAQNVVHMNLGCDLGEFLTNGETIDRAEFGIPDEAVLMLWVGGTDKRHGFDVAIRVLDDLPEEFYLVAKQSAHYPEKKAQHPRLTIIREDLPSLAPLYRAADFMLHPARGVGASMPVFEALACGLPVVSTDLGPIQEIAEMHTQLKEAIYFAPGENQYMGAHHLHSDCMPFWVEPDVDELVDRCLSVALRPEIGPEARALLSWERATDELEGHLNNAS